MCIICPSPVSFCSFLCCCWGNESSVRSQFQVAKWLYLVGWVGTLIGTWLLRDYASLQFGDGIAAVGDFCSTVESEADRKSCAGGQIAMRISFANFVFFAGHAVAMLGLRKMDDPRVGLHGNGWALKLMLWAGLLIGFFFVPSNAIYGYAQFARVGSGIFLVLQLILLIDLVYVINEWLTAKDNGPAWTALVTGAVASFSLGLVGIGFAFNWYTISSYPGGVLVRVVFCCAHVIICCAFHDVCCPSCHLNIFFITWSLIVGLILVGILFIPGRAPSAGLLTSGLVFLYCMFLLMGALSSEPSNDECTRGGGANPRWLQIVGFFIALATVIYSTISAGVSSRDMFGVKEDDLMDTDLPYRPDFYHAVFALGSLYIAMLFSNWQVSSSGNAFELDQGWISTWVKMASKWLCELLYAWSVVAPALFPNRDFSGFGSST